MFSLAADGRIDRKVYVVNVCCIGQKKEIRFEYNSDIFDNLIRIMITEMDSVSSTEDSSRDIARQEAAREKEKVIMKFVC